MDFAGPSYFGGVNDTFVLAASKGLPDKIFEIKSNQLLIGGEIYIWERASGVLLHSVKAPDQEVRSLFSDSPGEWADDPYAKLTNIAWNHKSPDGGFMFASAAHDGMVRICTSIFNFR